MPTITEREFYKKENKPENSNKTIPIDGYSLNSNIFCKDCNYFKVVRWMAEAGYTGSDEYCTHKENSIKTYDYKGTHEHIAWTPKDKNSDNCCELYERKKSIAQKIKIKLGFM